MSIGLSRMISGAADGVERGLSAIDRRKQRDRQDTSWDQSQEERGTRLQREDTAYQQGQDDRAHTLLRRGITEGRGDVQYNEQRDKQIRFKDGNDAIFDFQSTGNTNKAVEFFNKYSPDGTDFTLTANPDGSYTASSTREGKVNTKEVDSDEIGTYLLMMANPDKYKSLESDVKGKQAAAAKKGEREFEMKKLGVEQKYKERLEHIKNLYKSSGTGTGKGGKSLPAYMREVAKLSKEKYGGTYENGMWSFGSELNERKSDTHAHLAGAYYLAGDSADTNTAFRDSRKDMAEFENLAKSQADQELNDDAIEKGQYDDRVMQIIDDYVDLRVEEFSKKKAPVKTGNSDADTAKTSPEKMTEFLRDKGYGQDKIDALLKKYFPGGSVKETTLTRE